MASIDAGLESGRGRRAATPRDISWEGWKDILRRVKAEFTADRLTLVAAGVAFYLLLALFPALAAFVSLYGFVADPVTIADHIAFLGGVLPAGGLEIIRTQLESLVSQNDASLSFGFLFGLALALWSANNGLKTIFEALNVVYEESEKRSFVRLNLVSLLFTLGAIVIGILFILSVGIVPAVLAFVGLDGWTETLIALARWPVLFAASAIAIALLYRYGPSRERAQWHWIWPGAVLATALWLVASMLFSWYLANFADYNATYGSLGAVIGFMLWTWLSVVILLLGAEFNAELEHQTARDSTTGPARPMGARGAAMADTLGESRRSPGMRENVEQKQRDLTKIDVSQKRVPSQRRSSDNRDSAGGWLRLAAPLAALAVGALLDALGRQRRGERAERPSAKSA